MCMYKFVYYHIMYISIKKMSEKMGLPLEPRHAKI